MFGLSTGDLVGIIASVIAIVAFSIFVYKRKNNQDDE